MISTSGGGVGRELKYCFMTVMPNFTLCYAVCEGDRARLRQTGGERATEWSWEQCSLTEGGKKSFSDCFSLVIMVHGGKTIMWEGGCADRHVQTNTCCRCLKTPQESQTGTYFCFSGLGERITESLSTSGYIGHILTFK